MLNVISFRRLFFSEENGPVLFCSIFPLLLHLPDWNFLVRFWSMLVNVPAAHEPNSSPTFPFWPRAQSSPPSGVVFWLFLSNSLSFRAMEPFFSGVSPFAPVRKIPVPLQVGSSAYIFLKVTVFFLSVVSMGE